MARAVLAALLSLPLVLAGCGDTQVLRGGIEVPSASALYAGANDPADPWERMNRGLMDVSLAIDDNIARPVAETYRAVVPEYGRTRIRLFLRNLGEPLIFAHNLLQLRPDAAGVTLARFAINSTVGGLGLFDVASAQGLPRQSGDMGQTFARYGLPDGPFLFLPIAGPTNLRDALGDAADGLLNPVSLVLDPVLTAYTLRMLTVTRTVLGGVDLRAENLDTLDALRADSIDFYARLRSLSRQRREAELAVVRGAPRGAGADDPERAVMVLDDPDAPASPAPAMPVAVLDDPGAGSPPPAIAPASPPAPAAAPARPAAPRLQADPAWAGQVLQAAGLDRPGPAEAPLPARPRADPGWAGAVLEASRLPE